MFRAGPLKIISDGSLGARTACLSRPYADDENARGIPLYTNAELNGLISLANEKGLSVAVHAIGDGALDNVLDAYEKALHEHPRDDHRHGIVHCQIVRRDQIERMKELKLRVNLQSIFLDYDTHIVRERVGDELASTSYPAKTLLNARIPFSNGSDAPVEEPNVMRGMECAVTRRSIGSTDAPYRPEEALPVRETIDSFTKSGAVASFEEGKKGEIANGQLADFVVLSEDPFKADANTLHRIEAEATYLGGKCVYKK